jgi:hypothetical protein
MAANELRYYRIERISSTDIRINSRNVVLPITIFSFRPPWTLFQTHR